MRIAARKAFVILDGTLVPIDRLSGADDRRFYSGKHRRHGVNVQFLADPHGRLIRASAVLPGSTQDPAAARVHGIIDALTRWAIACYADKGYIGAGGAVGTPYRRRKGRKLGRRNTRTGRPSMSAFNLSWRDGAGARIARMMAVRRLGEHRARCRTCKRLRAAPCSPSAGTLEWCRLNSLTGGWYSSLTS